ncbi:TetR-like C-terminal domain-containing protein [Thermophilibacter immobilis]|uniref:TetR family transcriptional regulator C-terminal domain-containing protein n=1 Tax=Thermophilibacter immobilis TaxID=2779519 RepID=A0A7S7RU29_9ACTN|nr:TetR-like C-terminal domain-containing protein [Thermophilibacter immobilis]QOY60168.1 TetR family transcriptional regulator C-terminal domain-containing protein [Thermophilibacter immobilis]
MTAWGHDDRRDAVDVRVEDAVFSLMESTDIPDIRMAAVTRLAGISRSTFYRRFDSVDAVVKGFETDLLANMHDINSYALKARFSQSELDPTPTMVRRMELLHERRDKVVALNGPHGDPQFVHKATILMHDHFRERLCEVQGSEVYRDFYLAFVLAGHHNTIQYWLEKRPDVAPEVVAGILNRLFYAPFFLDEENVRTHPVSPFGDEGHDWAER